MKFGAFPPDAELVPTENAARLFGCSPSYFRWLMHKYDVEAVRTYEGKRKVHLWHPVVVLQFRKAHAINRERKPAWLMKGKDQRRVGDGRAKARETRQNTERLKILQRVAERKGTTVAKLVVDKGLQDWYRSLPNKYKE